MPRTAVVASLFAFLMLAPHAVAQQAEQTAQPTAPTTAQAPAEPAVRAIAIPDIEAEALRLEELLRKAQADVAVQPGVKEIEEKLPGLLESVANLQNETASALKSQSSVDTLRALTERWEVLSSSLSTWNATLSSRIEEIGALAGRLDLRAQAWDLTRDAVVAEQVPPAVRERIERSIEEIRATRKRISDRRAAILTVQSQVGSASARINEERARIQQARAVARRHLLEPDGPPLWRGAFREHLARDLETGVWQALQDDLEDLRVFAAQNEDRIPIHVLLIFAISLALWNARHKARRRVKDEPELARGLEAFEHPIASGVLIGLLLTYVIYPRVGPSTQRLIGICSLLPTVILLRVFLPRMMMPAVYFLAILFATNRMTELMPELGAVTRMVILGEAVLAVCALALVLRPAFRRRMTSDTSESTRFRIFGGLMRITLVGFLIAVVFGVAGWVQLARLLSFGLIRSAAAGLVFYALASLFYGLLLFAIRARPLRYLGMIEHRRGVIERRSRRILLGGAFAVWTLFTLEMFELRDPLTEGIVAILTASLTVGGMSVSLGDFVAFGLVVWASFLISRTVRFVLEEDVYPRVPMARGTPYAFSTLTHYVVLAVGFGLAIAAAGIDLDRFAILLGAFGVGIGFGLQNVVNNFVSGLILLFERPVQIGDAVQIGELQGRVTRIGIRASVVRSWDGAEVVVPNGNLISEPLVNLTLSDRQRRLELPVGVAYGNDPERVMELLLGVARAHPSILEDPEPVVLFKGFGESSLDFLLRAWTDRWDEGLVILSQLAVGVSRALGEAGIVIPFPQRDLHLKSIEPGLREPVGASGPTARTVEEPEGEPK